MSGHFNDGDEPRDGPGSAAKKTNDKTKEDREARLAEALRANLRRRKQSGETKQEDD
ncbi:MAG: hypothetical protein ACX939_00765 [Hyphococcus sp.]